MAFAAVAELGWGIDLYVGNEATEPTVTLTTDDGSPSALVAALARIDLG